MRSGFIERTLRHFAKAAGHASAAEDLAQRHGVLQRIDARVKVAGMLALVAAASAARRPAVLAALFLVALALGFTSHVAPARLWARVWLPALFFTGAIALPAAFLTPGPALASVAGLTVTGPGARSAAMLVFRAETAATLACLMVLTTPWTHVLKALRVFRCPVVLVALLGMTYRYIFTILRTAFEMLESRKSRTVGVLSRADSRRLAASAAGVLLGKSLQLSGDVHLAMLSRGFRGEVYLLDDFAARPVDGAWAAAFTAFALAVFWWGR